MMATTLNDFVMADYVSRAVLIVPVIVGIVQAVKMTKIPDMYAPMISIAIGIFIAFMMDSGDLWGHSVMAGIVYGLSASGLYSGSKVFMQNGSGSSGGQSGGTVQAQSTVTEKTTLETTTKKEP